TTIVSPFGDHDDEYIMPENGIFLTRLPVFALLISRSSGPLMAISVLSGENDKSEATIPPVRSHRTERSCALLTPDNEKQNTISKLYLVFIFHLLKFTDNNGILFLN
ncbi:MAG TPA: hypothetical protein VEC36_02140, partial [Patescibacteria group bacterium]|nr:hypothetical protein [Patescibacteria group bacterium]